MVLRAETFYLPPPTMDADAWDALPAADRALRWFEIHAQRRVPPIPRTVTAGALYARIDAGRWVAECACRSANVVSPTDPWMLCTVCLDAWHPLVFPADVPAAEATVTGLPAREQFWYNPADPGWHPAPPTPTIAKSQQ